MSQRGEARQAMEAALLEERKKTEELVEELKVSMKLFAYDV